MISNLSLSENIQGESVREKESNLSSTQIVVILMYVLVMVFICTGNVFTLLAVCVRRSLRTPTNMYIASLAVADFLTGLTIPYYTSNLHPAFERILHRNKYVCLLRYTLMATFLCCSLLSMNAISYDRYKFIHYPLRCTRWCEVRVIIAGTWILSVIFGTIPLYYNTWDATTGCNTQKILPTTFNVYMTCSLFFLCSLISAGFYGSIIASAIPHQRKNSLLMVSRFGKRSWYRRDEMKSVKMMLLVFGVFFVCWLPALLIVIIELHTQVNIKVKNAFLIILFLNSGMNFIIYAWKNDQFRKTFSSFMGLRRPSVEMSTASGITAVYASKDDYNVYSRLQLPSGHRRFKSF
ncbi:melanocortin receptor 5-like [Gigantopelta aegis]|uniref:melanocortin receptor 5-like n=1 Tax=Gigantopelta aegis TaxID=1735272 RepID=UPI001B88E077|nr:melanocortin receptor 5-like [Gigantopelta aegis]